MTYRDTLHELAADTEAQVYAAYTAHTQGRIDTATFTALLAAHVAAANARAASLADLSLSLALSVARRSPVAPLGLLPRPGDVERLTRAAHTLLDDLDDTPDPEARVKRLGRAEPLRTAADAYSEGMARSPHVTGWVRELDDDPCQLCTWWYRDGRVWPADHPMPTHPGCSCTPRPTTTDRPINPVAA